MKKTLITSNLSDKSINKAEEKKQEKVAWICH